MAANGNRRFQRKPAVREAMGWGNSTLYDKIKDGLFVPPIKVGPRISVWPSDETATLQDAYVAGLSHDDIRRLVANLVVARTTGHPSYSTAIVVALDQLRGTLGDAREIYLGLPREEQ